MSVTFGFARAEFRCKYSTSETQSREVDNGLGISHLTEKVTIILQHLPFHANLFMKNILQPLAH